MKIRRSYKVRLRANKAKVLRLDELLLEWQKLVNQRTQFFWEHETTNTARPPLEYRLGSTLIRRATDRAWRITKAARATKQTVCPKYEGTDIDFGEAESTFRMDEGGHFDGWISVQTLERGRRTSLPFNRYQILNIALTVGKAAKGIKLVRDKTRWFAILCVTSESGQCSNHQRIGIDVGVNLAAVTSTGEFHGSHLNELRHRTRHRKYRSISKLPYRQALNHVAKQIVADHPSTDFVCERLKFTGKRNHSRTYRSRLQNFAYGHLAGRLEMFSSSPSQPSLHKSDLSPMWPRRKAEP
jgi:transposase